MAHWMCTMCGYYVQTSAPPDRCPSCEQVCAFNDVTCYRPECGGERNIDPLLVGSTLGMLKRGPEPVAKPETGPASPKSIPLVELLSRHSAEREDLTQLSFWSIPQVEILRGLNGQQRKQLKSLGSIEQYEPDAVIFRESEEAKKLYLVEEGQVVVESKVTTGMRFPISIIYDRQAFGWSALVPPYRYTATVTALSKTRVIAIEQKALLAMMQANPSVGLTLMQNVTSIVASRLLALETALAGLLGQTRSGPQELL